MEEEEKNKLRQEEEELLEGVITINDAALGTVESWNRLELLDMMKMWKTTHRSAPLVADNVGHRLGYYFWRLWWSERMLQSSFSASQIYVHVRAINEGGNIRTTPRGSPRASRDLQIYFTTPQPASSMTRTTTSTTRTTNPSTTASHLSSSMPQSTSGSSSATILSPSSLGEDDDDGTATPTALSPNTTAGDIGHDMKERRRLGSVRPPPILKKAGSSGSSRSTSSRSPIIGTSQVIAETPEIGPRTSQESNSASTAGAADGGGGGGEGGGGGGEQPTVIPTGASPTPAHRYMSTRFSEQVAVSIPQSPVGTLGERGERSPRSFGGGIDSTGSKGSGKRSYIVHSGSVASRKRPIVMRQRSSQGSSSVEKPSPTSPRLGPQRRKQDDEGLTMPSSTEGKRRNKRAVSPHPHKQDRRASLTTPSGQNDGEEEKDPDEEDVNEDEEEEGEKEGEDFNEEEKSGKESTGGASKGKISSTTQVPSPLIDPNFRSNFANQARSQQQHRSFTNLPSAAWRSTTSTPTASSYTASGMMFPEPVTSSASSSSGARRGSVRAAFKDEIIPLKAPAPAGPEITVEDAEPADETAMPRTKSQLTLLLERNKAAAAAASHDSKGKSPAKS